MRREIYALLAALERHLHLVLADGALKTEDDLLGRLCLLVEDGLGLTTVTGLLAVVSALTLREGRGLSRFCSSSNQVSSLFLFVLRSPLISCIISSIALFLVTAVGVRLIVMMTTVVVIRIDPQSRV